jgi:hypothetical protein
MNCKIDYTRLLERIREKYGTLDEFTRITSFSSVEITAKLNNDTDFTLPEMDKVCAVLDIQNEEIPKFFFKRN